MAILKPIPDPIKGAGATKPLTLPAFSYHPNDGLAEMIVEAWANKTFRDGLLERDNANPKKPTDAAVQLATSSVNARGFNVKRAVVISEAEHDADYTMTGPDEVVFVLPDNTRLGTPYAAGSSSLLDTAKLLMACTPNGI
jgi:hypothetical protein